MYLCVMHGHVGTPYRYNRVWPAPVCMRGSVQRDPRTVCAIIEDQHLGQESERLGQH